MRRRILGKSKERIYLYKEGDKCEGVTGGWTPIINAVLNGDHIRIGHGTEEEKIHTVNDVLAGQLFMDVERTDSFETDAYAIRAIVQGKRVINSSILNSDKNKRIILKGKINTSGVLSIGSYFGVYKIYNIWIEK